MIHKPSLLLVPAACALALPALAQVVPDAGSVLRQIAPRPVAPLPREADGALPAAPELPAPKAGDGATLRVSGFRITGATVFPEASLQELVQDGVGRELDLAGLEALADRISRHYRRNGYTVARAYLPAQEIRDGVVEIAVVEGRLGAVSVRGSAPSTLPLAALVEGEVVRDAGLERSLLLASDVPGISVRSTLQPGAAVGTSELVVDVEPGRPVTGSVEADNFGSRSTGHERLGATVSLNNPAKLGDLATLRLIGTGEGLAYGRVSYQLPVNRNGTQVGAALSTMRYELQEEFEVLEAHGTADIASLFASHPFIRSRAANLYGQVGFDARRLRDRVDAVDASTDRELRVLTLGLSGDRSDGFGGGGAWLFSLNYTRGDLDIETPLARDIDALTARTAGGYGKVNLNLVRQQAVTARGSLFVSYTGQWASQNLDSSEKLALGGMGAVRAYPQGEWPSDRASLLTVEWRQALAPQWQGLVFFDAARGRANAEPWTGSDAGERTLRGAGVGLSWIGAKGLSARAFYAHRLGDTRATAEPDSDDRFWLQASWAF